MDASKKPTQDDRHTQLSSDLESDCNEVCEKCGSSNTEVKGVSGFNEKWKVMEHSWVMCLDCKHCWD